MKENQVINSQIDILKDIPLDPLIQDNSPPTNEIKLDSNGNPITELQLVKNGLY